MREKKSEDGFLIRDRLFTVGLLVASLVSAVGCDDPGETPREEYGRPAILEQARQRGALFRGAGNEPGWNVEIGPTRTTLVTNYGEERHEFDTPQPTVDDPSRRATYQARFDGHEILVELTHENCADTMSDETFPVSVRVELDGRELRGCGVMLAD